MDVPAYGEINGIKAKFMVIFYQWALIIAFVIGGLPGKLICQAISRFFARYQPKYFDELSGARCYPYYYLWKNMLSSILDKNKMFLYRYRPSAPIAYVYG